MNDPAHSRGTAGEVVSLPRETQFTPDGIVSRTLLQTAHSRVVLFTFAAGQELTEHTSTSEAYVHMLSGDCEFRFGEQVRVLTAGDLVFMPADLRHAVRALTAFSMLLTLVKVPKQALLLSGIKAAPPAIQ